MAVVPTVVVVMMAPTYGHVRARVHKAGILEDVCAPHSRPTDLDTVQGLADMFMSASTADRRKNRRRINPTFLVSAKTDQPAISIAMHLAAGLQRALDLLALSRHLDSRRPGLFLFMGC